MAMRNVVLYIVLAKHDNEQSDLIHRIIKEKILQDLPRSLHLSCKDFQDQCLKKSMPPDRCCRSVTFWYGSRSMDPVIYVRTFKMATKFLSKFFCLFLFEASLQFFKDKK